MSNLVRLHPDMNAEEEITVLLKQLPAGKMNDLIILIQNRVKNVTPAGLEAFKVFLAEKVNGVLLGEAKIETLIEAILNGTWKRDQKNITHFDSLAANDPTFIGPTQASNDPQYGMPDQRAA